MLEPELLRLATQPRLDGESGLDRALRLGLTMAGGAPDPTVETARLEALGARALPPYPGPTLIRPAIIPHPLQLREYPGQTYEGSAKLVAGFYRAALGLRFNVSSHAFVMGDITNHDVYPSLCHLIEVMWEREVAPAAWVLFSCDVWKAYQVTKGPPTFAFVTSAKRVAERLEWFEQERDRYAGGQTLFSDAHMQLAQQWRSMWDHLRRESPQDRTHLLQIVDQHFHEEAYERQVTAAQRANRALQTSIDRTVRAGGLVWG